MPACEDASVCEDASLWPEEVCSEESCEMTSGTTDCVEEADPAEEASELLLPSPPQAVKARITAAASRNKSNFFKKNFPFLRCRCLWQKADEIIPIIKSVF